MILFLISSAHKPRGAKLYKSVLYDENMLHLNSGKKIPLILTKFISSAFPEQDDLFAASSHWNHKEHVSVRSTLSSICWKPKAIF